MGKEKKVKHRSLLFIFMALTMIFICKPVSAATIGDLQNKFPNGAYWNHVVQQGHGYKNYQDVGACNNPDGYTWTPCATHNGNVAIGGYDCNSFGNAMQCCGFVKKLAYDLYGSMHTSWGKTTIGNAKPGDVIHYYGGGADAQSGHWAMIIKKAGTVLTFGECNVGSNCKISWGRNMDVSNMSSYTIYSAPHEASVNHNPEGCLDILEGGLNSVHIRGWVFDRDSLAASVPIHVYMDGAYVGAGVADKKRTDVNNVYGCGEYHGFDFKLPVKSSGTHAFKVFAINIGRDGQPSGQGNPLLGELSASIVVDETPPVISDVKVVDQDSSGYTVECRATDNRGIDRVQCPTWTVANGQDDLSKDWWSNASVKATDKGNGVYQFRINISEHNYEHGLYITHIYAYDGAGNYATYKVEDIEVLEDRLQLYEGFGRGLFTMDGRDARVIEFDVVAREGDEGSQLTITTSTNVNGKDITKNESYTIEKTGRNAFYHLVDRSQYNNGDGDYTTTAVLKDESGTILESEETTYSFANYAGPYYVTLNVGDEVDIFEKAGRTEDKNGYILSNWIWPDNCNICDGKIEYIGDGICKGKAAGRIYTCFINISSAVRETVIIDVVDPDAVAFGDVNQDGKIDGKDISMLLQYRLKKRELTEAQIAAGDVYKDGKIDGKDVSKLLQYRLGKVNSLD